MNSAIELVIKRDSNRKLVQQLVQLDSNIQLYDLLHILDQSSNKKETLKTLSSLITTHGANYIWAQPEFNKYRVMMEEENYFQTNPIDFEEGVMECRCGSHKTISYQRQTRSADEGATTFVKCVECKHSWRHNN